MIILNSWKPSIRTCVFQEKPDFVPDEVYKEALGHKRHYNERWEFWVYLVSKDFNCSQAEAEEACIRGIKREFLKMRFIWGDRIGQWFEEFMEMDGVFKNIKLPEYLPKLIDPSDSKNRIDQ